MSAVAYRNAVLHSLDPEILDRLRLRPVVFEIQHEIEIPGMPVDHLYFLEEGMASMTTTFRDGSQVEVGMFGFESVIGISALMGTKTALNRVFTQIAGSGYCMPLDVARREFCLGGLFQGLLLRYVQSQLLQTAQSAGCSAKHSADQRLARWLLICADRAQRESFSMSHEYLSEMLGSTRSTVTLAAGLLKDKGLISYSRGVIQILDAKGLENSSCECYGIIRDHLHNLREFDVGTSQ